MRILKKNCLLTELKEINRPKSWNLSSKRFNKSYIRSIQPKIFHVKMKEYNYTKGPNDPTFISTQRAQYIYNVNPKELESLPKLRLRTPHDSSSDKDIICFLEKDVVKLCKKLGRIPNSASFSDSTNSEAIKNINIDHGNILTTAITANILIFSVKAFAWYSTGSSSMLAESIHSLIDVTNQLILAVGSILAAKKPTPEHPYGWTKARHVFALISNVSVLSMGTVISVLEGFSAIYRNHELTSLHWAFSILGVSLILELCFFANIIKLFQGSFRVAFSSLNRNFQASQKHKNIFSRNFMDYLYKKADPISVAVLMEDMVAILGVGIALICVSASLFFSSSIPDSFGSIAIGCLLAASAILLSKRNVNFLLEKSIDIKKKESIVDFLESDKIVRSVHDVKAIFMDDSSVKFKAEIDFDGSELARAYLYEHNSSHLLKKVKKIKTQRQLNNFIIRQSKKLMNQLGKENDRLEVKIRKKFPEIRHIDLETL